MEKEAKIRLKKVLKVIMDYAAYNFGNRAAIGKDHDILDALAAGINMLGEELRDSTISLKEKEALVKEAHHRVKNNLQIVSSLLSLQANFVKGRDAREKFQESLDRVRSMALIHEMLYISKNLAEVNFREYLETLVKSLFTSHQLRENIQLKIDIEIQQENFDIDTAIPCGLIVNEIISNSLKHAFSNKQQGLVSLELKNIHEKKYLLSISDNGSGFPKNVHLDSDFFGLQLIQTLVEQIHGIIQFETGKKGTKYSIVFKL